MKQKSKILSSRKEKKSGSPFIDLFVHVRQTIKIFVIVWIKLICKCVLSYNWRVWMLMIHIQVCQFDINSRTCGKIKKRQKILYNFLPYRQRFLSHWPVKNMILFYNYCKLSAHTFYSKILRIVFIGILHLKFSSIVKWNCKMFVEQLIVNQINPCLYRYLWLH